MQLFIIYNLKKGKNIGYPADIREVIYTTNAIESLNSVIRTRKVFPSDDAALKVVYLAIKAVFKKWTMPIRD